ncbi:MAG: hypothetical protein IE933_08155 [Sphingomonadales bacterium]|nr:hypothetical protein [Sphingomonadales bacterium]MBD3772055.1 hypothetical protein [Paracoccaceae bacterium]
MNKDFNNNGGQPRHGGGGGGGQKRDGKPRPEWASGLKQLYDSVVDEPLPDAFKDLLSKLDDAG